VTRSAGCAAAAGRAAKTPTRLATRLATRFALCCALLIVGRLAGAQTIPGSGELLQQTPHVASPAPSSNTGLAIHEPEVAAMPDSAPFLVQRIEISGNTVLATPALHALVAGSEGKLSTLSQLQDLARLITRSYRDHGYLLSRAYIPPQNIKDGVVRIAIVEARYGEVSLTNRSGVSNSVLQSLLLPLQPGQPVNEAPLERSLLLLGDVPGAVVNSTLAPGAATGASDLEVAALPGAPYSGSVTADDAGNRYTGRARLSADMNINDPAGHADVLNLNAMSAGSNLSYGRIGYQTFANGSGGTVGAALSGLYYHLGNGLADLEAHGTAQVESLTFMQPLIRSTAGNLFAQIAFDSRQLRDEIDVSDTQTDRGTNALALTLAGDRRESSGISNINIAATVGHLQFDDALAEAADALSARTRGTYAKLGLSLAQLQSLGPSDSLYVAVNAQFASKNLDSSEQFFLGGPNSVRAYDVGTVGGAQGGLASMELRHHLTDSAAGSWTATVFGDTGLVQVYKDTFNTEQNRATLSGAGVGLNWTGSRGWSATTALATPVGDPPVLAGHAASTRLWIEIRKSFSASAAPNGG